MGAHSVDPGMVLADRYVVEDLLDEEGESRSWRARDKVLARSVVLQVLPASSPYADEMLAGAKRASRVADPRILQVLDAVNDGALAYVVREWASGQSLDVVLHEGPLPARRAAWLTREVAGAIANAHRMGLPHRRLAPDTVVITKSSGVKVVGLGTYAALQGDEGGGNPEFDDTLDLGRLLYACLTARWPGGDRAGLPAAPTEHGRLLRPRQVRAGVPRPLDVLCDRILGQPPRVGEPLTTVTAIGDALTQILVGDGVFENTSIGLTAPPTTANPAPAEPPPALLAPDGGIPRAAPPAGGYPLSMATSGDEPTSLGRTLLWVVVAVLIVAAVLLAYMIGQNRVHDAGNSPSAPAGNASTTPSSNALSTSIKVVAVTSFDPRPLGSGNENPGETHLAVDGNPATAWQTKNYFGNPRLGGLKPGVGLILDLGSAQTVGLVDLTLVGSPTTVELRAAPAAATSAPSKSADQYQLLKTVDATGSSARFDLAQPVQTRYLLVWLTSLPKDPAGSYRGQVAEIRVFR
ncbi:MAG: protein kinase family protein [Nocardioidaceae bacterium]